MKPELVYLPKKPLPFQTTSKDTYRALNTPPKMQKHSGQPSDKKEKISEAKTKPSQPIQKAMASKVKGNVSKIYDLMSAAMNEEEEC